MQRPPELVIYLIYHPFLFGTVLVALYKQMYGTMGWKQQNSNKGDLMNYVKNIIAVVVISLFFALPAFAGMGDGRGNSGNLNGRLDDMRGNVQNGMNNMQNRWQDARSKMQDSMNNMQNRMQDRRDHMRDQLNNMGSRAGGHSGGGHRGGGMRR